jgi:phosphotransferase system HPr (HPr) family protein
MSIDPHPRGPLNDDPGSDSKAAFRFLQASPSSLAMNGQTFQRPVTITNPQGFHMRPATAFAQLAGKYESTVTVCKGDQRINGKSPLELMFLGAEQGTELILEVSGSDASAALEALAELMAAPSLDDVPESPGPPKG